MEVKSHIFLNLLCEREINIGHFHFYREEFVWQGANSLAIENNDKTTFF